MRDSNDQEFIGEILMDHQTPDIRTEWRAKRWTLLHQRDRPLDCGQKLGA